MIVIVPIIVLKFSEWWNMYVMKIKNINSQIKEHEEKAKSLENELIIIEQENQKKLQ